VKVDAEKFCVERSFFMLINHNKYAGLVTGGNIKTGKGIGQKENIHTKGLPFKGDTVLKRTPGMDSAVEDFAYFGSLKGGFVGEDTDFLKIPQKFPGPSGLDTGDISLPPVIDDTTEKELPSAPGTQTGDIQLPGKGIYEKMNLDDGWNIATGNDSWTMELGGKPVILENHMPYEKETFSPGSIRNHDEPPMYNVADSGLFDHLKDAGFNVKKVDVSSGEDEWAQDMLLKTDVTRHMPTSFWSAFEHDVRQLREKVAKPDFIVLGEDFGKTEDFPVIPLTNPDGYEYPRGKGLGVDLNRYYFDDDKSQHGLKDISGGGIRCLTKDPISAPETRVYNSQDEAMSALYDLSKNSSIPPYAVVKETDDGKWAVEFSSEKPSLKGQPGIMPTYLGEPHIEYKPTDGLSVYLPGTGEKNNDYSKLAFARDTTWQEALKKLGERPEGEVSDAKGDIKALQDQIVDIVKNYPIKEEPKTPLWKEIYDANAALPEDKRKSFKELKRELLEKIEKPYRDIGMEPPMGLAGKMFSEEDALAKACNAKAIDIIGFDACLMAQDEVAKELGAGVSEYKGVKLEYSDHGNGFTTISELENPAMAEQIKKDLEQARTIARPRLPEHDLPESGKKWKFSNYFNENPLPVSSEKSVKFDACLLSEEERVKEWGTAELPEYKKKSLEEMEKERGFKLEYSDHGNGISSRMHEPYDPPAWLNGSKDKIPASSENLIGFDACLMAQDEVVKELKNATIETSKTGEINRYTMLPSEDSEAGDGWSIHGKDRKDISGGGIRCLTKDPTGAPGSMVYNSYEEAVSAFFDLSEKSSLPPYGVVKETDDKKWSLKFTSEKPVPEGQSGLPTCFTSKTVEITSDSYFLLPSEDSEGGQTEQINEALKKIEPERKKTMDKFTSDLERKLLG